MNINRSDVSTYATWVVASWIFSDDKAFNEWTAYANNLIGSNNLRSDNSYILETLSSAMLNHYLVKIDREVKSANMFNDLLNHEMQNVKWLEIAELVIDSREITDDA